MSRRQLLAVVLPEDNDHATTQENFKEDLLAKYELPYYSADDERGQQLYKKKINNLYSQLRVSSTQKLSLFDFYYYQTRINQLANKQRSTTVYTYYETKNLFLNKLLTTVDQPRPVVIKKQSLKFVNRRQTLKSAYIQTSLVLKKIRSTRPTLLRLLTTVINRSRTPLRLVFGWRCRRTRFFKRPYYRWRLFRHTAQHRWRVPAWRRRSINRLFSRRPIKIHHVKNSTVVRLRPYLKRTTLNQISRVSVGNWQKLFNLFSTQPNRRRFNIQRVCFFHHKKTGYLRYLFSALRLRYGTRLKARGATKIKIPAYLSERRTSTNTRRWLKKIINQQPHRRLPDRIRSGLTMYQQLQDLRQRHLKTTIQEIAFL